MVQDLQKARKVCRTYKTSREETVVSLFKCLCAIFSGYVILCRSGCYFLAPYTRAGGGFCASLRRLVDELLLV